MQYTYFTEHSKDRNRKDETLMYCSRCGSLLPDNAYGCPRCGYRFAPRSGRRGGSGRKRTHYYALFGILALIIVCSLVLILLIAFNVISVSGLLLYIPPMQTADAAPTTAQPTGTPAPAEPDTPSPTLIPSPPASDYGEDLVDGISDGELLEYFCDIGLHIEYGDNDEILKRWEGPILVQVSGDYTEQDYNTLTSHIDMLNSLGVLPQISIVGSDGNFLIYFIPLDEMDDTIPGYEPGNWGYFFLGWDWDYIAREAYIGIATDVTTQEYRNHLILEEVTQALGLMNDSPKYKDSIFQIDWTDTQSLSGTDIALIKMLYYDDLKPGMGMSEVMEILSGWLKED